jgi:hypothetical protein
MNTIVKNFKSTLLGVLFIATGVYLLVKNVNSDYYIISGLFVSGVLLLFAPDTFINFLEKKVLGKVLFAGKEKEGE